jgi:hypothetical protein
MNCYNCNTKLEREGDRIWCPKCGVMWNLGYIKKLVEWAISAHGANTCENCEHYTIGEDEIPGQGYCNELANATNDYRTWFDLDFSCKYFTPKGGRNEI